MYPQFLSILFSFFLSFNRFYTSVSPAPEPVTYTQIEISEKPLDLSSLELPSITLVQEKALAYAKLNNYRLHGWERRVRLKAFLPTVSIDFEKEISNNIDIDRSSTTKPDLFIDGPDDKEASIGLSLSWDLGDFIWNDTETSIEMRREDFIDQREDVLREVTRLYYEWMRLEHSIQNIDSENKNKNELIIKREEVKSQLNGWTGGFIHDTSVYQ